MDSSSQIPHVNSDYVKFGYDESEEEQQRKRSRWSNGNANPEFPQKRPLTERFWPTLRIMQLLCYFPSNLNLSGNSFFQMTTIFWIVYSLFALALNGYLLRLNFFTSVQYIKLFGLLHTFAVSSVITGLKPLINLLGISIFGIHIIRHKRLLRLLDVVDGAFRSHFHKAPNIELYNLVVVSVVFVSFFATFAVRITEHLFTGAAFGQNTLYDLSIVVVPLLSTWNILPLVYFEILNRIVRFWLHTLRNQISGEFKLRDRELRFYYDLFHQIASVQEAIGYVLNPFLFFSVGWSLFSLCLTIYFITQGTKGMNDPPPGVSSEQEMKQWLILVKFIAIWSFLQIIISLTYIGAICYTGTRTNELTREILEAVLAPTADPMDNWDRYQITCFVHKLSLQYMWGMSIWRIFPLERSLFFTLVSMIVTYSFLLLKLKEHAPSDTNIPNDNSTEF